MHVHRLYSMSIRMRFVLQMQSPLGPMVANACMPHFQRNAGASSLCKQLVKTAESSRLHDFNIPVKSCANDVLDVQFAYNIGKLMIGWANTAGNRWPVVGLAIAALVRSP